MTEKIRELLEDVQTVYEGKGMVVHPNSFDKLRMEVIKLDNINKQQSEQIEKMKCCANCEYYSMEFLPYFCIKRQTPTHCIEHCEKWEKEEIKVND